MAEINHTPMRSGLRWPLLLPRQRPALEPTEESARDAITKTSGSHLFPTYQKGKNQQKMKIFPTGPEAHEEFLARFSPEKDTAVKTHDPFVPQSGLFSYRHKCQERTEKVMGHRFG